MSQHNGLALVNANVRTVDGRDSVHSALLVQDGRFAIVGSEAEVRSRTGPDTGVLDVGGRTVVPGFVDPHNHLSVAAFEPDSVICATPPMTTLDEVLRAIEAHCKTAAPGQWVRGMYFTQFAVEEQRGPNRYELDEVAPDNPFFLIDVSCHLGWANSSALAALGIDAHTPNPWGGEIVKDDKGEPTGFLVETACGPLHSASWDDYAERDRDRAIAMLEQKCRDYLAAGITGVGDAMVPAKVAELYRRADQAGRLPLTVLQLHHSDYFFAMQDLRRYDIVEQIKEADTHLLRGGAMKIFVDPGFPDGPAIDKIHDGCRTHVGASFYTREQIHDLAVRASELGINTAIHAIGNCSVDIVLDAYEKVRRRTDHGSVLRIEHAFVAESRQGARIAELDIDLVVNPGLCYGTGDFFSTAWRGSGQPHLRVLPVRSMMDAGARVSLASDHPAGPVAPMEIIWSAVTRRTATGGVIDEDEAITAAQALRAYTANAAHACKRADEEGSIEVGKRGTFLVLDRDIVTCAADEIREAKVDMTFVDGALVHERAG